MILLLGWCAPSAVQGGGDLFLLDADKGDVWPLAMRLSYYDDTIIVVPSELSPENSRVLEKLLVARASSGKRYDPSRSVPKALIDLLLTPGEAERIEPPQYRLVAVERDGKFLGIWRREVV